MSQKKENDFLAYRAMKSAMNARIMPMLVGDPATSKTATVKALAEEMGYFLIVIVPARMEPQDLSGFPVKEDIFNDSGEKIGIITTYAPQYWQRIIMEQKKVMLFIDEFSNTPPAVRASLLSFVQDRQFPNGEYLPHETILVGAMNPTSSSADGYDLDKPTVNRMMFIPWKPTVESWLVGFIDNWGHNHDMSEQEKQWRRSIHDFINENKSWLHKMNAVVEDGQVVSSPGEELFSINIDPDDDVKNTVMGYAWPSRRSWDNLARVLGKMEYPDTDVEDMVSMGLVGVKAMMVFRRWLDENNRGSRIDVEAIFHHPDEFHEWSQLSHQHLNDVLRYASENSTRPKFLSNFYKILVACANNERESEAAPYLSHFIDAQKKIVMNITDSTKKEEAEKTLNRLTLQLVALYQGTSSHSYESRPSANEHYSR